MQYGTRMHVQNAVFSLCFSMLDVFSDQFGLLDFQRSQHGSGMSGRSKVKSHSNVISFTVLEPPVNHPLYQDSLMRSAFLKPVSLATL